MGKKIHIFEKMFWAPMTRYGLQDTLCIFSKIKIILFEDRTFADLV